MRIAMVNLTGGGLSGGYRKYLAEMTPRLARALGVEALEVFVPRAAEIVQHVPMRRFDGAHSLEAEVAAVRPDVVFVPSARWVGVHGVPTVVMVRNMEPLVCAWEGNSWAEALRNWARAWAARRACRQARRVIAVSGAVRDFLIRRWRLPEDKIAVVSHGVNSNSEVEPRRPSTLPFDLSGGFLFTAGSLRPARGLADLCEALEGLDAPLPPLVVAGSPNAGTEGWAAGLRRRFERTRHRVLWAGQLNVAEMTWCFRHSCAFVMTSRAEACPNTVLEALAAGAISISTDTAPMPEFYRDAALYYKAGDGTGLAAQIRRVVAGPQGLEDLRVRARQRSSTFTWDETARRTIEELERACHADSHRQ